MEYVKEIFEGFASRSRSHFFSAILISFLIFNWQPIYFVLYSDVDILERFDYFDSYVKVWWPIGTGVSMALLTPGIILAGSWWAGIFSTQVKILQVRAADKVETEKDRLKQERATATVKHGQDIDAELGEIEDEEVRDSVRKTAFPDEMKNGALADISLKALDALGSTDKRILLSLINAENTELIVIGLGEDYKITIDGTPVELDNPAQGSTAISALQKGGFIEGSNTSENSESRYQLTDFGQLAGKLSKMM